MEVARGKHIRVGLIFRTETKKRGIFLSCYRGLVHMKDGHATVSVGL